MTENRKSNSIFRAFLLFAISTMSLAQDNTIITIEDVIDSVKGEIKYAQSKSSGPAFVKIDTVTLKLAISTTVQGSGAAKGKIPVLGIDAYLEGSRSRAEISSFEITFRPDQTALVSQQTGHPLGDMILAAKSAALHAQFQEPKFALDNAVIELGFEVQKKVGGGFSFLFIKIGGSSNVKTSHSVRLRLTKAN